MHTHREKYQKCSINLFNVHVCYFWCFISFFRLFCLSCYIWSHAWIMVVQLTEEKGKKTQNLISIRSRKFQQCAEKTTRKAINFSLQINFVFYCCCCYFSVLFSFIQCQCFFHLFRSKMKFSDFTYIQCSCIV